MENNNSPHGLSSPLLLQEAQPKIHAKTNATVKEKAIARYAFSAQKEKDLSFNVGDIITVEKKRNNGWWIGSLDNGQQGYFPTNYVELFASPDEAP
jgi:hypothetical protein